MSKIFYEGQRITYHVRSQEKGGSTTLKNHMPKAHQQHAEWTPAKFLAWASTIGECMKQVSDKVIREKSHPEWSYRIHLGFINLKKK